MYTIYFSYNRIDEMYSISLDSYVQAVAAIRKFHRMHHVAYVELYSSGSHGYPRTPDW